jgi:hypothetical protein
VNAINKADESCYGAPELVHPKVKPYLVIFLTLLGCLLLMTVGIYFKYAPHNPVTELETATARIPLGISTAQADALMVTPPDAISQTRGTLMNSMTLLSTDNSQSVQQGSVQLYSLRTWHRGDRHATVVIDQSDKVAGHWTWSDHPPARAFHLNPNEINNRVCALWQSLFG